MTRKLTGKDGLLNDYQLACSWSAVVSAACTFLFTVWPSFVDSKTLVPYCLFVGGWSIPRTIFGASRSLGPLFEQEEISKISRNDTLVIPMFMLGVAFIELLFGFTLFASRNVAPADFLSTVASFFAVIVQAWFDLYIVRSTIAISNLYRETQKEDEKKKLTGVV